MAPTKALLISPDKCIGCRACQVACKGWNELPAEATVNRGGFENPADLSPYTWNRIRFIEEDGPRGPAWRFVSQRCLHCSDAPCVSVCPSGALEKTVGGGVVPNARKCISCRYCAAACPFDVPRYGSDGRIAKCHLCPDRTAEGLPPACAKACPTGAIRFGERSDVLSEARAEGMNLYGEAELGGLGVLYALADAPESYGLPPDPRVPEQAALWRDWVRPLGWFGFWGAIAATLVHYVTVGPKNIPRDDANGGNQP